MHALAAYCFVPHCIAERMPDDYSTYDKYRYLASIISLITSYDYSDEGGWQSCNRYSHKLTTADILVENEYLTY